MHSFSRLATLGLAAFGLVGGTFAAPLAPHERQSEVSLPQFAVTLQTNLGTIIPKLDSAMDSWMCASEGRPSDRCGDLLEPLIEDVHTAFVEATAAVSASSSSEVHVVELAAGLTPTLKELMTNLSHVRVRVAFAFPRVKELIEDVKSSATVFLTTVDSHCAGAVDAFVGAIGEAGGILGEVSTAVVHH